MTKWCEITDQTDELSQKKSVLLNESLQEAGLETELSFEIANDENLAQVLEGAKKSYDKIRVGGRLGSSILKNFDRLPSSTSSLKTCDSLVYDKGVWWPRSFLSEGLNRTLASDAATLDLGASVLILGTTPQARAAVAALSRIGFDKIIVSDPSVTVGSAFVEDLRRSFFGTQFQSVARSDVTQLPGICSIAVNTLTAEEDAGSIDELAYFNFLKPGGFWLDLAIFPLNMALQAEAMSVGATIVSGARVLAAADRLWAESVFDVKIETETYAEKLTAASLLADPRR